MRACDLAFVWSSGRASGARTHQYLEKLGLDMKLVSKAQACVTALSELVRRGEFVLKDGDLRIIINTVLRRDPTGDSFPLLPELAARQVPMDDLKWFPGVRPESRSEISHLLHTHPELRGTGLHHEIRTIGDRGRHGDAILYEHFKAFTATGLASETSPAFSNFGCGWQETDREHQKPAKSGMVAPWIWLQKEEFPPREALRFLPLIGKK